MTNPLSVHGVDETVLRRQSDRHQRANSEQDPLTLLQWEMQPSQLNIGQRIGAGGCGWIYQGTFGSGSSVRIACKEVISATIDPEDLREFQHEARMMAQLHHPFVIKFYGVCTKIINNEQTDFNDEQRMYMVTELASGGSLEEKIQQGNHIKKLRKTKAAAQLPLEDLKMPFHDIQTTCWALQIAAGMAHSKFYKRPNPVLFEFIFVIQCSCVFMFNIQSNICFMVLLFVSHAIFHIIYLLFRVS